TATGGRGNPWRMRPAGTAQPDRWTLAEPERRSPERGSLLGVGCEGLDPDRSRRGGTRHTGRQGTSWLLLTSSNKTSESAEQQRTKQGCWRSFLALLLPLGRRGRKEGVFGVKRRHPPVIHNREPPMPIIAPPPPPGRGLRQAPRPPPQGTKARRTRRLDRK